MSKALELLRQGRKEELWQMCCGFIDLSLDQFMAIQRRLLLEQIELLKDCELGRKVMRGAMPETVEEFREQVPLTTYADYCPELLEQREDVLPAKPAKWVRTSGRSGEYAAKWVPLSEDFCRECVPVCGGLMLLALSRSRGDVSQIKEHLKVLFTMGPPEYGSGAIAGFVQQAIRIDFLPSNPEVESFEQRIKAGFEEALYEGIDAFGGLPFVLIAVAEQFKRQSGEMNIRPLLAHPGALFRLVKGVVKSKLARRPLLPKDIWTIKAIIGGGTDTAVFKTKVEQLWGRYPLEVYAGTEGGVYAMQTWDYEGMTFIPSLNFLEFIPEAEYGKWRLDHSYQPRTVLLDEVKAGENYEIVMTNFHGGAMVRYRVGDMVRITALRNDKLGTDIPQMVFERRADDLIDLGPIRLTEKVIWQAIENTTIPYADWAARKEIIGERAVLRLFFELKDNYIASEKGVATAVYEQIKKLDDGFIYEDLGSLERLIDFKPIEVTLLAEGAFANYRAQRQAEGADLAHLKPPHINPSESMLSLLGAKLKAVPEVEVAAEAVAVASQQTS
ncbi:MAG: GH3 auxin-responsive promoter family protein [Dehalococcoidia bacterium]|nr:GH3 auxin-responsive promoter family protein [Dehalococcoidia bacterium]